MKQTRTPSAAEKPQFLSTQIESADYYFLNLKPGGEEDLVIACGGLETCSPNYVVERTEFRFYGIEYIISGQCKLTLDGNEQTLTGGSLFCYGPSMSHRIENTGNMPLAKHFIDFAGLEADALIGSSILGKGKGLNLVHETWIRETFETLSSCGKQGGPNSQNISGHLLRYLIARLQDCDLVKEEDINPSFASFKTCCGYIESFYYQISGAQEIADACHISHPHLCRLFKRFSDETPSRMLLRLKLTRSADLLEQGQLLVKEVAERVGFDDQYYFSKRFKEYFGVCPREYTQFKAQAQTA